MDIVNLLGTKSASVKVENAYGWRPIHLAVSNGHVEVSRVLIVRGCLEDKTESSSLKTKTLVQDAARRRHWAEAYQPHQASRPLHLAIEYEQYEIARILIENGAKVDEKDDQGWRPLHHAAFNQSADMVELLLSKKVYAMATTNAGQTARDLVLLRDPGLPATDPEVYRIQHALHNAPQKSKWKVELSGGLSFRSRTGADKNQSRKMVELAKGVAAANPSDSDDEDNDKEDAASVDSGDEEAIAAQPTTSGALNLSLPPPRHTKPDHTLSMMSRTVSMMSSQTAAYRMTLASEISPLTSPDFAKTTSLRIPPMPEMQFDHPALAARSLSTDLWLPRQRSASQLSSNVQDSPPVPPKLDPSGQLAPTPRPNGDRPGATSRSPSEVAPQELCAVPYPQELPAVPAKAVRFELDAAEGGDRVGGMRRPSEGRDGIRRDGDTLVHEMDAGPTVPMVPMGQLAAMRSVMGGLR